MSLSAYELERLETIRQNQAKLVEMGLEKAAHEVRKISEQKKAVVATEKKERHKRMPAPPTRVSKRLREERPQYTSEKIDRFGEELDARAEKQARSKATDEDKTAAKAEAMEVARQMLQEARARVRRERESEGSTADPVGWRVTAISRWGERCTCEGGDWEGFVASRDSTPAPTSEEMLLQEYYADDGWKLLVACALMSRVSSHETKTRCIEGFFELCPTPTVRDQ